MIAITRCSSFGLPPPPNAPMTIQPERPPNKWNTSPTLRTRNAVQREVTALLDGLAPERAPKETEQQRGPVEQHRTPNGCVLQAEKAALSVSWFSATASDPLLGELSIIVWRGIVSRRGAQVRRQGATVVGEMVFYPVDDPTPDKVWRAVDGENYSTPALAAFCTKLLDAQVLREA